MVSGLGCTSLAGLDGLSFGADASTGGGMEAGAGGDAAGQGGIGAVGSVGGMGGTIGPGGGTGGSSGGGGGCDDVSPTVDYAIRRVENPSIALNANCTDAIWSAAPAISFVGGSTSSNTTTCRMVWEEATALLYGCCVIDDLEVVGVIDQNDMDPIDEDDSFEYYFSNDVALVGGLRPKLQLNARGKKVDSDWSTGTKNLAYSANTFISVSVSGTINDDAGLDQGWTVEWRASLGFSPGLDEIVLCDFMVNDKDAGVRTVQRAIGSNVNAFDDPTTWGTCQFACAPAL